MCGILTFAAVQICSKALWQNSQRFDIDGRIRRVLISLRRFYVRGKIWGVKIHTTTRNK